MNSDALSEDDRLPWWISYGKETACNVGDVGLIPGLGRSSGEENGNSLQYSYLENSFMGFSRQEFWSRCHSFLQGYLSNSEMERASPVLQADYLALRHLGSFKRH